MTIPDFLNKHVLCFDVETADMGDHVCEIGFSLFKNAQLVNEWGTFVRPMIPIHPDASNVHKIYDSDVEDYPVFAEIAWYVYNILNSADIHVAYNYDYDRGVLEKEFARLGQEFPLKPAVDPFILFKQWHKFHKGKRLINAADAYGISLIGAHRAMNDATATGRLLFKMAATKTSFPKNIKQYVKKQREWIEAQFEDFYSYRQSRGQELPTPPNYGFYEFLV